MKSGSDLGQILPFGAGSHARPRVSVVIPFFNEAPNLPQLIEALNSFVGAAAERWPLRFEVVFVDDGSDDGGGGIIERISRRGTAFMDIRLVRLSRNFGKEVALTAGLSVVDSDAVIFMDADLQHPIQVIESFLDGWLCEGFDVVYAYRKRDRPETAWRRFARGLFYRLLSAEFERPLPPDAGDFRLMSKLAYQALRQFGERQRLMKGFYTWIGFRQKGVPFVAPPRVFGNSKYSLFRLCAIGLDGVTSFSVAPLRLAVWTGVALALVSVAYGVFTAVEKMAFGVSPPGYPTIVFAITMIGATQLVFLGVIGEYVGKVLIEVKGRPLFILESDRRFCSASVNSAADVADAWRASGAPSS